MPGPYRMSMCARQIYALKSHLRQHCGLFGLEGLVTVECKQRPRRGAHGKVMVYSRQRYGLRHMSILGSWYSSNYFDHGGTIPFIRAYAINCPICSAMCTSSDASTARRVVALPKKSISRLKDPMLADSSASR